MEQTATLRRGSAIASCVPGAARQLLGDNLPGSCLILCNVMNVLYMVFGTQMLFFRPVCSDSELEEVIYLFQEPPKLTFESAFFKLTTAMCVKVAR